MYLVCIFFAGRTTQIQKNQVPRMEREYFENLLGGVWEVRNVQILKANNVQIRICFLCVGILLQAWEHAYRQSSAERKKAEAKAEIERLRKEESLVAGKNSKNRAFAYICIDFSFKRLFDPFSK